MAADEEHTMAMKTRDSTNTVVGPHLSNAGKDFSMELFKDVEVWSEHLQARRVITVELQNAASTTACLDRVRWTTRLQHDRISGNGIKIIPIEIRIYRSKIFTIRWN